LSYGRRNYASLPKMFHLFINHFPGGMMDKKSPA